MNIFKIKQTTAVKLFKALGFETADTWPTERLLKKLNNLPEISDEDKIGPKVQKFLDAIEAADEVAFKNENGETEMGTKKKKKKGIKKKKANVDVDAIEETPKKKSKKKGEGKAKDDPKPKAKAAKKTGEKKLTRIAAVVQVIQSRKKVNMTDLATQANALCVKGGGRNNPKETVYSVKKVTEVLSLIGYITIKDDTCRRNQ